MMVIVHSKKVPCIDVVSGLHGYQSSPCVPSISTSAVSLAYA